MTDNKTQNDAFFQALNQLNEHHASCRKKAAFLNNVLTGAETVTFQIVDRCREACLQLNQSAHVVEQVYLRIAEHPLAVSNGAAQRATEAKAAAEEAAAAMATIVGWVPQAINSRASTPSSLR